MSYAAVCAKARPARRLRCSSVVPPSATAASTSAYAAGLDDDRDGRVVLGRGAHHRRPADVDLLDALVGRRAGGHRLLERVEVDHDELERRDAELLELAHVVGQAQVGQDAGVHLRVQRLDPAVQALREAGQLVDRRDRDPGVAQPGGRRAGRDDLDAGVGQRAAELLEAGLVVDADERPADRRPRCRSRAIARSSPRRSSLRGPAVRRRRRRAGAPPPGSCSAARPRRRRRAPARRPARSTGPVSTPSSTRCTVTPESFTPYASASATACAPGNAGSSAGWVLTTRCGKRPRKPGPRMRMKPASTTRSGSCAATASASAVFHAARSGLSASAHGDTPGHRRRGPARSARDAGWSDADGDDAGAVARGRDRRRAAPAACCPCPTRGRRGGRAGRLLGRDGRAGRARTLPAGSSREGGGSRPSIVG